MIGARVGIYSGKGIPFTGVLDGLNTMPEIAFSVRRLTGTSWATDDVIMRLRRSSDDAEADFSYSTSNRLDGDSIAINATSGGGDDLTTWAGADTLYMVEYYNQGSLNGNASQSTTSLQPIFDLATLTIKTNGGVMNASSEILNYVSPVDTIDRMFSCVMKFLPAAGTNGTRSYPLFFQQLDVTPNFEASYDIRYVSTSTTRHILKYTSLTSGGGVLVAVNGVNCSNLVVAHSYLSGSGSNNAVVGFNGTTTAATWSTVNPSMYSCKNLFNVAATFFKYECLEIIWGSYYDSSDFATIKSNQTAFYGI